MIKFDLKNYIGTETHEIKKFLTVDKQNGNKYLRTETTAVEYGSVPIKKVKWFFTLKLIEQPVRDDEWLEVTSELKFQQLEEAFKNA